MVGQLSMIVLKFQPTRPLRGATRTDRLDTSARSDFNPRAPCGARLNRPKSSRCYIYFNPRAPCGARPDRRGCGLCSRDFNPRAPCGARPIADYSHQHENLISTHAPLAGRDARRWRRQLPSLHFNPRAPCGARPIRPDVLKKDVAFQPTRPLRGATASFYCNTNWCKFQPTRPLRGATGQ